MMTNMNLKKIKHSYLFVVVIGAFFAFLFLALGITSDDPSRIFAKLFCVCVVLFILIPSFIFALISALYHQKEWKKDEKWR